VLLEDYGSFEMFRRETGNRGIDESRVARVTAVDRDRYMVGGPFGSMPAEASGRLLYCAATAEEMPCVGDWVVVDYLDGHEHAVIHETLPRRTILRRRAAGSESRYQPIASNIDVAFIVQSCVTDYNLKRLDRYIVMAVDGGIVPRLLLTKTDLVDEATVGGLIAGVRDHHVLDVVAVSNATGAGYEAFVGTLRKGETYCLIGSSGVGKSTILNRMLGSEDLATHTVRDKSGKGRHTTTRRQLVVLESGAVFVDTPGMRELGMMGFEKGLEEGFRDIADAAGGCRYADCTHTHENGCAVIAMVDAGELPREKYESYLALRRESRHYETSFLERKQKDRVFGRMVKSYGKSNRKS
jgi:ribosome biogenesis GTPase / thiamine phosphate phosphatase